MSRRPFGWLAGPGPVALLAVALAAVQGCDPEAGRSAELDARCRATRERLRAEARAGRDLVIDGQWRPEREVPHAD